MYARRLIKAGRRESYKAGKLGSYKAGRREAERSWNAEFGNKIRTAGSSMQIMPNPYLRILRQCNPGKGPVGPMPGGISGMIARLIKRQSQLGALPFSNLKFD